MKKIFESEKNILAGFTDRHGGFSNLPYNTLNLALHVGDDRKDVLENRKLLAENLAVKQDNFAWMEQVHSGKISIVKKGGKVLKTDGLITTQPGLALMVLVADCIPILFYDSQQKVVAIAHAGREGSFLNIAGKMILKMQREFGSDPQNIKVFLGPSIQKECYELNTGIVGMFKDRWGEKYIWKQTNLDLPLLNKDQLLQVGVLANNIELSNTCNHCNDNYFSYRRAEGNRTGRFGGIIFFKMKARHN